MIQSENINIIKDTYNLRILLHKYVYSIQGNLLRFNSILEQSDIFNIVDFNEKGVFYNIKIKKTNIKKKYNFSHNSLFYYSVINDMFRTFLLENISIITQALNNNEFDLTFDNIMNIINNNIQCLYDITVIADNAILIKL